MIIFTRLPQVQEIKEKNYNTGEFWRYIPNSQLVAYNPKDKTEIILTKGFFSAHSPDLSGDGEKMLFAGRHTEASPWQIWEMNLSDLKYRQVIVLKEDCTDPVYLPGDRLVFSKMIRNDTIGTLHQLFVCNIDGSGLKQITFHPHANFASSILKDGRIVTISKQLYPTEEIPVYMVLRPDGTKADVLYNGIKDVTFINRARETNDGKILFIESGIIGNQGNSVTQIKLNRPLFSRENLTPHLEGIFYSVLPWSSETLLVTFKGQEDNNSALYEFDLKKKSLSQPIYKNSEFNIIDAVVVEKYERQRKLPSEVDEQVKTGLLMCQNVNLSDSSFKKNNPGFKAQKIEILGINKTYGIVQVEQDGSFYLKVIADMPFRIQTLDENGNILNGPCGWLWLRPNERRGCIGCHEDPELSPENRAPLAVKKNPVIVPVHVSEITEKEIELE